MSFRTGNNGLTRTLCVFFAAPWIGFCADGIQTYRAPKEFSVPLKAAAPAVSETSKPLSWTVPEGWKEQPASGMRIGSFLIPGENGTKADLAIMAFPGDVGGELSNVNRWRKEIGLEPIDEAAIVSSSIPVGAEQGKLYEFTGAQYSTSVAWVMKDGTSWFFKLRGDSAVVAAAKPAQTAFLKSVQFLGTPNLDAASNIGTSGANPHKGLLPMAGAAAMPAGHPAVGPLDPPATAPMSAAKEAAPLPTWQIPATWQEQPVSMMVLKSYLIGDPKGAKAAVTISSFPGQVGGNLANVNRWRAQLGLKPIAEGELAKSTQSIEDGKATFVDLTGTDPRTSQPARLMGVIVPHGGSTWFYKMVGDSAVVAGDKENLLKVVQTVTYP